MTKVIIRAFVACVLLAAPARAQTAAAPSPDEQARAAAALAVKDPAAAAAALEKTFAALNAPRVVLPTWEQVQRERMRRDLMPRGTSESPRGALSTTPSPRDTRSPLARRRRDSRESLDVAFSRPLPHVELGLGWTETAIDDGRSAARERVWDDAHAFLRIDLSKAIPARKLLHSPTFVHRQTETSDERIRATREDYDVHSRP